MKVIFDHLDKTVFVLSAYQIFAERIENQTEKKIKPLSLNQLISINNDSKIDSINGVHLGLKFKGNYVEFEDSSSNVYINLLYKMKTTNPYFIKKMKEDFIIEFEYNNYVKEINEIEDKIDECKAIMDRILNQLIIIRATVLKYPDDFNQLVKPFKDLELSKNNTDRSIATLLRVRNKKIKDVFELEGYPSEDKYLEH